MVAGLPKKPQLFAQRRWPSGALHLCSSAISDLSLRSLKFLVEKENSDFGYQISKIYLKIWIQDSENSETEKERKNL